MLRKPPIYHCTWEWKLSAFSRILILPRMMIGYVIFSLGSWQHQQEEREKRYFKQKFLLFAFD